MRRAVRIALAGLLFVATSSAQAGLRQKAKTLYEEVRAYAQVAAEIARLVKGYPGKLAELRRLRAQPAPLDTGFNPARFKTAEGQLELLRKAELLGASTRKHLHDKLLITGTDLDPQTFELIRFFNGLGDAGAHHGMYLAALSYRYGVTGAQADLDEMLDAVAAGYNQLTLTSAPNGFVFDPRTGQRLSPRPGLPIRGYANIASPLVKDMDDLATKNASVWAYEGTLAGLPKAVYRFNSDISRDELDGIFFGLGAAFEVLQKRNVQPEWRARIGQAMAQTARYLIQNKYKLIDFTGKVTEWGDESSFVKDPTSAFNVLSWFATTVRCSGDAFVRGEMNRFADRVFGKARLLKAGIWAAILGLAGNVARNFPELIGYTVNSYNHHLMAMWLHNLVRDAPDAGIRALAVDFLNGFAWPLAEQSRVPFFDYVYLNATGQRTPALLDRAIGFLGQVRNAPFPRGNPVSNTELMTDFSTRADLRDPLHAYLTAEWKKIQALIPSHPAGPLAYGGSAWPLGPGLVPMSNFIERAQAYELKGWEPYAWSWTGDRKNLRGYPAHDYLLSYWFGRYYGLIAPNAAAGPGLDAPKTKAEGTAARLANELKAAVAGLLARAKAWVVGLVHRLESQSRCVSQHVNPLAQKLGAELRANIEGRASAFFAELGPTLTTLSISDRHAIVDAAWGAFTSAVQQRVAEVRSDGERTISPWFGKSANREAATQSLRAIYGAAVQPALDLLRTSYERVMRGMIR